MAKIKRSNAKLVEGILDGASGSALPITFHRNNVITGLKEGIPVKRPGQYKRNK